MINVIGLGYIGLPTALMFAATGQEVVGTDININLLSKLKNGEMNIDEAGMSELYSQAIENGIEFCEEYKQSDYYIIAVPTPYDKRSKKIDSSFVENAFKKVLEVCLDGSTIILESTVSPGTIDKHIRPLLNKSVNLVHAPERIIPGNMIYELKNNSRTIGADTIEVGERVKELYSLFCKGETVVTDIRTAEMTKVVENTYRDINIAFANELAKICRSDGLDVYEIIRIANKHPRVNILQPGPGVGGHCISVDPWFLVGDYPGLANIVLAARKINDSMPEFVLERIHTIMQENGIKDVSRVGLYGLTYKENVDDVRESPTLQLLECMKNHLANGIKVFDPYIKDSIVDNQYFHFDQFVDDVDMVVIMTAHKQLQKIADELNNKIILDTKNTKYFTNAYLL